MKRLTTDNPKNNLQTALNLFYAKDGEAWVRGGGPEYEYQDVPLFTYIRSVIQHQGLSRHLWDELDNETLAEVLTEWLFDGHETTEGIIATLYTAAWAFAEIRARLKAYEDTGFNPMQVSTIKADREALLAILTYHAPCEECDHWDLENDVCTSSSCLTGEEWKWRGAKYREGQK